MTTPAISVLSCHYGMAQRWLVVYSQAARERAEVTVNKAKQRSGGHRKATLSLTSPTLSHARGGPRCTEGAGQALALSPG